MSRFRAGDAALLALAFAVACAQDSSNGGSELVAPDASIDASASGGGNSDRDSGDGGGRRFIAMLDDCDPRDRAWNDVGGCLLRRGNVTFAEFNAEAYSPLVTSVVGHQAWRNDPTYLIVEAGKDVRVKNEGGRIHSFTKVAEFGGGLVPPLNVGTTPAPECAAAQEVRPGESIRVTPTLNPATFNNNRYQCCFHPWMRAVIKVKAK